MTTITAERDYCGSRRGYKLHAKRGERPCDQCREAHRIAMAEYRSKPGRAKADAWYAETRRRALEQLAREFPARFLAILDEIRDRDPRSAPALTDDLFAELLANRPVPEQGTAPETETDNLN